MLQSSESKSFWIITKKPIESLLLLKESWIDLTTECIVCSVLIPFRKSNWLGSNKSWNFEYSCTWIFTAFCQSFAESEQDSYRSIISWIFWSPALHRLGTLAIDKLGGSLPSYRDLLLTCVITGERTQIWGFHHEQVQFCLSLKTMSIFVHSKWLKRWI